MTDVTVAAPGEASPEKNTSLALAIVLSILSLSVAFIGTWVHHFGFGALLRVPMALEHPGALAQLISESVGASLALPTIHVALASFFKSKRNPSTRRKIYIGWALFIILLTAFALWQVS